MKNRITLAAVASAFLASTSLPAQLIGGDPVASGTTNTFNGQPENQDDSHGYYYVITGGQFPTGTTPNGDNASGGTMRFILDDPAWGSYPLDTWQKDDWFTQTAGLALTAIDAGGNVVYDNNGIETGTYGNFYDATGLADSSTKPGLYRGYSMSNNYDWIYGSYFKVESTLEIKQLVGYFDANSGLDPLDPDLAYRMNVFSAYVPNPDYPTQWMPGSDSFFGDVMTSDVGGGAYTAGSFTVSDTGVDRIFGDDYGNTHDDILRLVYTFDTPLVLGPGEYFFSHDAVLPEPRALGALGCLALAGIALLRRRRARK